MWGNWGVRWPKKKGEIRDGTMARGSDQTEASGGVPLLSEDWSAMDLARADAMREGWPGLRFMLSPEYLKLTRPTLLSPISVLYANAT
jgi:hypothetical protein